jgi:uncharacterized protein (DUF427 family)
MIYGADYPITIERSPCRIQVRAGDTIVANTTSALTVQEGGYFETHFIPPGDVDLSQLRPTRYRTVCQHKGEADCYDIVALGKEGRNAAWTYRYPYPPVLEIAGYFAFNPNFVWITRGDDAYTTSP